MKVLVIKISSMGDVVHTLPAITDAAEAISNISFDWVIEKPFSDIPKLHPYVHGIIPIEIRRWRKNVWRYRTEVKASIRSIQQKNYDVVIDAQGLIKSAYLTHKARGEKYGFSKASCREPLAAIAYQHKIDIPKSQHAITRVRQLFAKSLGYTFDSDALSYGLRKENFNVPDVLETPYLVFLHGTTWASKHWPNEYWKELVLLATEKGFNVYLPWGNQEEKVRAGLLSGISEKAHVLPRSSIKELSSILMFANGVVGVDSGLAHLTAACGTPEVTIYGSTSAELTGTMGDNNAALQTDFSCSPCLKKACEYMQTSAVKPACYQMMPPQRVFDKLQELMI